MAGRVLVAVSVVLALTACSAPPPAPSGNGLGQPVASITELADLVKQRAGACNDVKPETHEYFTSFVGAQQAELYKPFLDEWATCFVSPDFPKVGLVLFRDFKEFQASWRDAMTAGRVSDAPAFGFGNGFAVTQGYLATAKLGLFFLRCHYDDPKVHQVPADVDGCVFANPEHRHH
ncbi:hypothetical protein KIPE111705_29425 [Kibdelosporangium persicum]|uniref:Lipoprotein n=1 Tax=Kibdelosporangium persicum TaxID=2698649 RepID=A0ABX2F0C6_9PSEU|nr:hypothetical protein [Kibdelosporangium persicum]NRN64475.1 hypothetical protein [Kibdelosporangium persicum]